MLSVTNLLNRDPPTLFSKSNTNTPTNQYPYYHHQDDSSSTTSLSSTNESLSSIASSSTSSLSAFTSISKHHQPPRPAVLDICNLLSPPTSPQSSSTSLSTSSSSSSSFECNKKKIKRKRATAKQVQVLNQVFEQTLFPSTQLRMQLGKELGMSPRTVQIWFQNRRQAIRMREQRRSSNL